MLPAPPARGACHTREWRDGEGIEHRQEMRLGTSCGAGAYRDGPRRRLGRPVQNRGGGSFLGLALHRGAISDILIKSPNRGSWNTGAGARQREVVWEKAILFKEW